jgi:glycosyltransferase involved in cell wall biosynthesis
VPYWINAANAVLVPSAEEGFGLSVIEALACGVPAFGTPVGIHPVALHGIAGALCAPWDPGVWRSALEPILAAEDPRVDGRARAELFSADRMAARVVEAWRDVVASRRSD